MTRPFCSRGSSAQVRLLPVTGSSAAVTQAYVQGSTATVFLTSRQLRTATDAQSGAAVTVNATDPAPTVILAGRSIANARNAGVAALQVQFAAGTVTLDSDALAALDLHKDIAVSLHGAFVNAAQQRALGRKAAPCLPMLPFWLTARRRAILPAACAPAFPCAQRTT